MVMTPEYCRANARQCEELARKALDHERRALFRYLAEQWDDLVREVERLPTWH
jgi:hypothetical protein